jgi:dihydrofolate reductase
VLAAGIAATGALILGRRSYDLGAQVNGFEHNPYHVPHIVLSHTLPATPARGTTPFVFVADGVASALQRAHQAAGERAVVIGGGANTAQQFLRAGLVDELHLHVIPKLVGQGLRLFAERDEVALQLERIAVVAAPDATHLSFRVLTKGAAS